MSTVSPTWKEGKNTSGDPGGGKMNFPLPVIIIALTPAINDGARYWYLDMSLNDTTNQKPRNDAETLSAVKKVDGYLQAVFI